MAGMNSTPLSVSVGDAATLTSFSTGEIRKAINTGELTAIRNGRRLAIRMEDLHSWLESLPKVAD